MDAMTDPLTDPQIDPQTDPRPATGDPVERAAAAPTPALPAAAWTVLDSPIGELRLVAGPEALQAVEFSPYPGPGKDRPVGERDDDHPVLRRTSAQLGEYFAGRRRDFDLPLAPEGTPFQQRVWQGLCAIGYGETTSYGELARRLGLTAAASRAVGLANGRNPIPVIVPCHRVIGADGRLTGYAGGLDRKRTLLELEQHALF